MAYEHGINIKENSTSVTPPVQNIGGVLIAVGTAPIHLAADPLAVTNVPVLANTFGDAESKLGYSENFSKYTLCEAMYAALQVSSVGPVVFINVLDPTVHKTAVTDAALTIAKGAAVINDEGVLLSTVKIKSSDGTKTYVKDTDYTISFNAADKPVITVLTGGTIGAAAAAKVTYDKVDASKVTKADIIGGYDSAAGKYKGLELIQQVYPRLGVVPGLLIAPGFSQYPDVYAVMVAKVQKINGSFNADVAADIDTTVVTKYEEVPTWKNDNGYTNARSVALWPKTKIGTRILHASSVYAASLKALDSTTEDVPANSPSNRAIAISGACLANGTEIYLDPVQANYLNGQGIVTFINWGGWKVWGNNTAAYPGTTDPKDRFINLRRLMNWWGNSFVVTFWNDIDDLTSTRLIEGIVDSENIRANGLVAAGYIAGASIEFREEDNPQTDILNGKIQFLTKIGGYTPAEQIVNTLEFDPTFMVNSLFGGA
ncbi:phage tail sheath family protein [Niallia sp. BSM11]|uniref:phage tail sheath family protein n=1 Tax=Niallia sp. BSM11 TaxID=3391576 RepID=UPI0039854AA0